jgi:hypothetical protein
MYDRFQKLSRYCFASLAMTSQGFLSLREAEGDEAISGVRNRAENPQSNSRLPREPLIRALDAALNRREESFFEKNDEGY